jgi:hypothetical protein
MSNKDVPVLLVSSPATCDVPVACVLLVLVSLIHADDSLPFAWCWSGRNTKFLSRFRTKQKPDKQNKENKK